MRKLILILVLGLISPRAFSQAHNARPADNAALRYWMAFALMSDAPISPEAASHLDAILTGASAWDESQFGPLLDQNKEALDTMTRGTHLPYCDWGIEYNLGPDAPAAYVPKARALARLNVLRAKRQASTGDFDGAIATLVAGLRFGRHLAENASFFGALTAKTALVNDFEATRQIAESGHLSSQQAATLRSAMNALPTGGLDWPHAAQIEGTAMRNALTMMSKSADPKVLYKSWFGDPAPADFHTPTPQEIAALDRVMTEYSMLLGLAPEVANARLSNLQTEIDSLSPTARMLVPNPSRMITARGEIIAAQQKALKAVSN